MPFAKAQIKRIIKKAGAKRVGSDAVDALSQLMEDKALEMTGKAIIFAKYTKRRTLKKSDFELTQLK